MGKAAKKSKDAVKGAIPGVAGGAEDAGGKAGKKGWHLTNTLSKDPKAATEAAARAAKVRARAGRGAQAAQRAGQRAGRGAQGAAGAAQGGAQQAAGSVGGAGRQAMGSAKQGAQDQDSGGLGGGDQAAKAVAGGAAVAAATTARYGLKAAGVAQRAARTTIKWTSRLIPLPIKVVLIAVLVLIVGIAGLAMVGSEIMDEEANEEYEAMLAWCEQQGGTFSAAADGTEGGGDSGDSSGSSSETSGDQLSYLQIAVLADYGLRNGGGVEEPSIEQIQTATAITVPESNRDPNNHFDSPDHGDDSYGLWQTNLYQELGPPRREWFGLESDEDLFSPKTNAISMGAIWRERGYSLGLSTGSWKPWSTFNRNEHLPYMDEAREAAADVVAMHPRVKDAHLNRIDPTAPPVLNPTVTPSGDADFDANGDDPSSSGGDLTGGGDPCGLDSESGDLLQANYEGPEGSTDPYSPGAHAGITPTMRNVLNTIVTNFGRGSTVGCLRDEPGSDHHVGRACDFMLTELNQWPSAAAEARGWAIADFAVENAAELDVRYVIFGHEIWESHIQEWRPYTRYDPNCSGDAAFTVRDDRSSLNRSNPPQGYCVTLLHWDHPHISVQP